MSEQTCKYMLALHHLNAIKEKLDAVQEKGEEFYAISNRVLELENQMEKLKEGEKVCCIFPALWSIINDTPDSGLFRCYRRRPSESWNH
jgi:hypothetical protein